MKITKLLALILTIILIFACTSCENLLCGGAPKGEYDPINVIMINDNHGVLDEEQGGMDRIASGISYYASLGNVVKIANGDMFQGTYVSSTLRGLPILDVLKELDFDAFVL